MIKLSKKGNYALKSVIYIATKNPQLLKIKNISQMLNISESLLRRIIADLEKGLILETIKGRNGGVKMKKDLSKVNIFDILICVGEDMTISSCTSGEKCENQKTCLTSNVFNNLQRGLHSMLKMQTLDKIIPKK